MQHLGQWAAGIVGGVLALAVLFYAANATSAGTYNSALFLFVILVLFVFAQIKRGFDQAYKARHYGEAAGGGATGGGSGAGKSGGKAQTAGQNAAASGSQSAKTQNANGQGAKNGAAPQSDDSASSAAATAGTAAKTGLSETTPSGPTNGTGAKP